MFYEKVIDIAGWKPSLVNKGNYKNSPNTVQKYLSEVTFSEDENSPDEIYFSGEYPFIQIKNLSKLDNKKIQHLHSKIWNEGQAPFLAVFTPTEMRLYNCYEPPVENKNDIEKLQIDKFEDVEKDLKRIVEYLHQSKIDSGKIWEENYGKQLSTKNRVDKKLVANLKFTRSILYNNGLGLPLSVVHALLGRALFIFYLEDRKILTTDAYPKKPEGVSNFHDLLSYRDETYSLFDYLKGKFNGDLFPISNKENDSVNIEHLKYVRNCFYHSDVSKGQASLWKMFQFDYIPIELISAIYEEFMSEEEEEKNGKVIIKENGAYYTKPMLVEFMLNEVLPWPDENNKRYDYKILDPACGSGIFLVESYRRLIARWKFSNKKKKINEDALRGILTGSIYGIDKDPEAIKVAAFSLYLTFLNYLEPVEIRTDYLENKTKKLDPLIRWSIEKELLERKNKQPGNNLFQYNTFDDSDIKRIKFDIIVGNPPWKKDKPEPIVANYIKVEKLPSQIACAYLNYMPALLDDDGTIALVIAAKILFNTGNIYEDFRQNLFKKNEIETIINLSVVRDIMFDNATAPGAVVIYKKSVANNKRDSIVYCVPKNIKTIDCKQSLIIDSTEVKYIPLSELLKRDSKILKIAMWGGMRDYQFIKKLQNTKSILNTFSDQNKGIGLHIKDQKNKTLNEIFKTYKFLPLNKLQRYITPQDGLTELGDNYSKYRDLNNEIFSPPLILLKRGTIDTEFCCSYIDFNCVFTDRIYSISIKNRTPDYCKALVACLNSTICTYYLFMISSTWAVDKQGDVLHEEITTFPAITENLKDATIKSLAQKVDEISSLFWDHDSQIMRIEKEIDRIIYNALGVTETEQALVNDVINNSIALKHRYSLSRAESLANVKTDLKAYADFLSKTLYQMLKYGSGKVWVEILDTQNKVQLHIVIIHFTEQEQSGASIITNIDINKLRGLITEINNYSIVQHSESIYYRKVFRYYKEDKIYIIKPNEKRFWTISEALNDADLVLSELITP